MRSSETPEQAIIRLYKDHSKTMIRKLTGCRKERVDRAISIYTSTGRIPEPAKIGRPSKKQMNF